MSVRGKIPRLLFSVKKSSPLFGHNLLIRQQLPVLGKFRKPLVQNPLRLVIILLIPLYREAVVIISRQIAAVNVLRLLKLVVRAET